MYSKLFADHGIQVTEQEVEVRRDSQGLPRLWFRSAGNPLVGLDLTGASQLRQRLEAADERRTAAEISRLIDEAKALGIGEPQI
jgi:hypothetical protein